MEPISSTVSTVTDIICSTWECCAKNSSYLYGLEENLDLLKTAMDELKNVRDDIKGRILVAEAHQMTCTRQVAGWLQRVETMEVEVTEILRIGSLEIEGRCIGCCSKNCWTSYKFARKVVKKLAAIEKLRSKGEFGVVADWFNPKPVQAMQGNKVVGMDSVFDKAWRLLGEDEVSIMGLYGMGGVGKTTLLKKINNKFLEANNICNFDVVIWVVVSKEFELGKVQKDIEQRLGLSDEENKEHRTRATTIFNILSRKRFVVLLDDIWEHVDLEVIGIPLPNILNRSKVVFTTRSEAVCGSMETNIKIRVECLNWDMAWNLFQIKVGQEALNSHPEIPKLAKVVAQECCGLPLALIVIGRTMASKKTPQEWNHAITMLKNSGAEFSGMVDGVFPILKFSYDNLENDTIRSCFTYCSLYPEDYSIEKGQLIEQWLGEGFLDGYDHIDNARNMGHAIIGSLKVGCLLDNGDDEESQVKMHDVVRDLALWLVCECGTKKDKFLVQAGFRLSEPPKVENWTTAKRISLMSNRIKALPPNPKCPNLSTLLLQENHYLSSVPTDFFRFMSSLRVLDLSWTGISDLPKSVGRLVELQLLNLSHTSILSLPNEFNNLRRLKYLNLEGTSSLKKFPHGMISHLSQLQALDINWSCFSEGRVKSWAENNLQNPISLTGLDCLECLNDVGITAEEDCDIQSLFNSSKLQVCLSRLLITCNQSLVAVTLVPSLSPRSTSLRDMERLKVLIISNCPEIEEFQIHWVSDNKEIKLLSSLEVLRLEELPKITITWEKTLPYLCFKNLSLIKIDGCHALKDMTWLVRVPALTYLWLRRCDDIEEIILDGSTTAEEELNIFSNLERLHLQDLPKLKKIFKQALAFSSLKKVDIQYCPLLKKLPFDSKSAKNTLKSITGEIQWWAELEWEDEIAKTTFQQYFEKKSNS